MERPDDGQPVSRRQEHVPAHAGAGGRKRGGIGGEGTRARDGGAGSKSEGEAEKGGSEETCGEEAGKKAVKQMTTIIRYIIPVRIERSRDAPRRGAAPMGVSTSGECRKFILSACKAVEGLDTNGYMAESF